MAHDSLDQQVQDFIEGQIANAKCSKCNAAIGGCEDLVPEIKEKMLDGIRYCGKDLSNYEMTFVCEDCDDNSGCERCREEEVTDEEDFGGPNYGEF